MCTKHHYLDILIVVKRVRERETIPIFLFPLSTLLLFKVRGMQQWLLQAQLYYLL